MIICFFVAFLLHSLCIRSIEDGLPSTGCERETTPKPLTERHFLVSLRGLREGARGGRNRLSATLAPLASPLGNGCSRSKRLAVRPIA